MATAVNESQMHTSFWNLDSCLKEIARWHTAWTNGADMQKFSLATIQRFTDT